MRTAVGVLKMDPERKRSSAMYFLSNRVWIAAIAIVTLASCERTPTKSDYVSARVTEMCRGKVSDELQACRLAVIKQFTNVSLEELQRRYPAPEPRLRPSCGL